MGTTRFQGTPLTTLGVMIYKLEREKVYWYYVLRKGRIVGICHRGSSWIWYAFINTEQKVWIPGEFKSVQDAFNAFIPFHRRLNRIKENKVAK